MRREEMALIIESFLEGNRELPRNIQAEHLLQTIEVIGMQPPAVDGDKCQALMRVYMDPSFNRWDEDFEKDEQAMEAYKRRMEYKGLSPTERVERRKRAQEKLSKK